MNKRRFRAVWLLLIGLLCALTACTAPADRLSPEEIEALRADYPICREGPDLVTVRMDVPIEEYIERADTFVYGEVTGEVEYYTKDVVLRSETFYRYTLTVLDDSEGIYEKGTRITIFGNARLETMHPKFQDGMRIIAAVSAKEEDENIASFGWNVFYVTEDGYVLSAFDEAASGTELFLSGMRTEDVLQAVKKDQ